MSPHECDVLAIDDLACGHERLGGHRAAKTTRFFEASLDGSERVLEAPEGFPIADIDESAQDVLLDDIDVAVEVRLEELEYPAEGHAPFGQALPEDDGDVWIAWARAACR